MNAIKEARRVVAAGPGSEESRTLARLALALESEFDFPLASLYALNPETFSLAMKILKEWRIDHYYTRRGKLLDVSYQVNVMASH